MVSDTADPDRGAVRTCDFKEVLSLAASDSIVLFKCDIEGSEYELFQHADVADLRRVRRYAIEFHDHVNPGTSDLLRDRLSSTHTIVRQPASGGAYGMLYATAK